MNDKRQSIRLLIRLLCISTLCLGHAVTARAASLVNSSVLIPVDDVHVRSGFTAQKKNFGQEPVLELQGGKNESEVYFKFQLSAGDAMMKQAKLRFYAGAETPSVVTVAIRTVPSKDWGENLITWKDKPEQTVSLAQVQLVGTSPTWYEVDLTAAVKAELDSGSTTFSIALVSGDAEGNKISINSKESVDNKPELVLSRAPVKIRLVFRPGENGTPPGYMVDTGGIYAPHTNGFTYGWNEEVNKYLADRNSPAHAQPKQARSPDSRYAALASMDHPEMEKPAFWGISLPNGKYNVHVVAGDPGFYDSVYALNVNDSLFLEGIPDQAKRWVEATKVVSVTNQKLIVTNNPKGINNKLCFIEIQEVRESGK